jgi:hypothetical protein
MFGSGMGWTRRPYSSSPSPVFTGEGRGEGLLLLRAAPKEKTLTLPPLRGGTLPSPAKNGRGYRWPYFFTSAELPVTLGAASPPTLPLGLTAA